VLCSQRSEDLEQKSLLNRYLALAEEMGLTDKSDVSKFLRAQLLEDTNDTNVPSSLLWFNRALNVDDPVGKGRSTTGYTEERPTDMYGSQKDARRMSVFEGALAELCLHLWTDPGDVVLDPFAGRLTRLVKTVQAGRSYTGYDTSKEACGLAWDWLVENISNYPDVSADVANVSILDEGPGQASHPLVDAIITCPPYWNSEFYGDHASCLAGTPSYTAFLEELVATFAVAVDRLRQEGYVVIVLKDFYFHRQMISFHSDVIRGMTALGLVQWDCVAKKIGTQREIFHRDIIQHRRTAQTHEYVLVFRKCEPRKNSDSYRKHCYESNEKRRDVDVEKARTELRQRVLREHGVEPKSLHPFVKSVRM